MATVRLRRLARDLRQYREDAGLTTITVADRLGWDRTKISRLENAKVDKPKQNEIAELLDLYGVPDKERAELLQITADARRRGWWRAFGEVFGDGTYPGLEDEAAEIFSWRSQLVPGLLQTEAYAWAVLTASNQTADKDAIHTRVQARMARRPLLSRPGDAPRFHTVLDEAVLRREIGGPDVMREQIKALAAAAHRPNITIQVLPFGAGAHAGVDGSFVMLSFPGDVDPDVVFIEIGLAGDIYPESEQAITRFRLAAERLTETALSPEESAEFLRQLDQRSGVIS
jgi:transcriptional regulator with XRE-family HTH domain